MTSHFVLGVTGHVTSLSADDSCEPKILLFGTTQEGWSVGLIIEGFEPFFDVEVPVILQLNGGGYQIKPSTDEVVAAFKTVAMRNRRKTFAVWNAICIVFGDSSATLTEFLLKMKCVRIFCKTMSIFRRCVRLAKSKRLIEAIFRQRVFS